MQTVRQAQRQRDEGRKEKAPLSRRCPQHEGHQAAIDQHNPAGEQEHEQPPRLFWRKPDGAPLDSGVGRHPSTAPQSVQGAEQRYYEQCIPEQVDPVRRAYVKPTKDGKSGGPEATAFAEYLQECVVAVAARYHDKLVGGGGVPVQRPVAPQQPATERSSGKSHIKKEHARGGEERAPVEPAKDQKYEARISQ